MSFYRDMKPMRDILEGFWRRKTQNILVEYDREERRKMSETEVVALLTQFAGVFPEHKVNIEKRSEKVEYGSQKYEDVFYLTIPFDEWPKEKVELEFVPERLKAYFYVYCGAGLENDILRSFQWGYPCNLEATLKKIEVFVKKFSKHREQAEGKLDAHQKEKKLVEMARKSIETILPPMMAASGYEWHLSYGTTEYKLSVKMKNRKMLTLTLTHKNFAEAIAGVLSFIGQMSELLDQTPCTVDIGNCDRYVTWRKGAENVK